MEFRKLYKDNPIAKNHVENMKQSVLANRRSKRLEKFNKNRNNLDAEIEDGNGASEKKSSRQALLLQWKQKKLKEKKMIDEKKKKPFVVGLIRHNIGSPLFKDISNLNKAPLHNRRDVRSNKVVALNEQKVTETTGVKTFPFVTNPSKVSQFKFKLQPSLKKLTIPQSPNFLTAKKKKINEDKSKMLKLETIKDSAVQKENVGNSVRNLRNRGCRVRLQTETPKKGNPIKTKLECGKATDTAQEKIFLTSASGDELHPLESMAADVLEEDSHELCTRIEIASQDGSPVVSTSKDDESEKEEFVISPFVTLARGKQRHSAPRPVDSAKKQDLRRMSKNVSSLLKEQEDEVASEAAPYYERLDKETKHIIDLCDNWSKMVLTLTNIPKEVKDEIDTVVGQSRLLVKDKFEQFRSLVHRFESKVEPPVVKSDLDGFWDMMYIQVDLVNERFSNLTSLKENKWIPVSEVSSVKLPKLKRQVKKSSEDRPIKQPKGRGNFRQFLKEMKEKNTATPCLNDIPSSSKKDVLSNNLPFNISASPKLNTSNVMLVTPRKSALSESLLKKALSNSINEKVRLSTGGAHIAIRTSLIGKELGTSPVKFADSFNADSQSNQSILLKSPRINDSKREKKVVFGDTTCISPCEDDNDDLLNTTFTLQDDDENDCEQNLLNRNCGFVDSSLEEKEVCINTSKVTPKHSRKRKLDDNFTPRRSTRLLLRAGMSTPTSVNFQPELSSGTARRNVSGTPHPKK